MRLLLDTHALLWWLADDDQLGPQARELIEDPGNDVLISAVSLWETVVKVRVGKLAVRSRPGLERRRDAEPISARQRRGALTEGRDTASAGAELSTGAEWDLFCT